MLTPAGPRPLNPKALLINRTIIDDRVLLYILEEVEAMWARVVVGRIASHNWKMSEKKKSVQLLVCFQNNWKIKGTEND